MEFVSFEEMEDYFDGEIPKFTVSNGSYFTQDETVIPTITKKVTRKYIIRTYIGENYGYMYLGKKGVTFYSNAAAAFEEETAKIKAVFMSKNSKNNYSWEAILVR